MGAIRTISIAEAIGAAETDLARASATARLDSEVLLAAVCHRDRSWLYGHTDSTLDPATWKDFRRAIARRADGEPVAHITGLREFWSITLKVTPETLVPRPDTETLVQAALDVVPEDLEVSLLDAGTGSGAIALALARERPRAAITATDVSPAALEVARSNALEHELDNIRFVKSDWFDGLEGEIFDMVVSNPPYVPDNDEHLDQGDCRFEPRLALAAGEQGLDALKIIIGQAPAHLTDGGRLLVEHGYDQRDRVTDLMRPNAFADIQVFEDLAGVPRVVSAQRGY